MLGLNKKIVELVAHRSEWKRAFLEERARLVEALPAAVSIEHVGSTAVPGLPAKPILDTGSGERTSPTIWKQRRLNTTGNVRKPLFNEFLRGLPQRNAPFLSALSVDAYVAVVAQVNIADVKRGDFGNARARIVEGQEHHAITPPAPR